MEQLWSLIIRIVGVIKWFINVPNFKSIVINILTTYQHHGIIIFFTYKLKETLLFHPAIARLEKNNINSTPKSFLTSLKGFLSYNKVFLYKCIVLCFPIIEQKQNYLYNLMKKTYLSHVESRRCRLFTKKKE